MNTENKIIRTKEQGEKINYDLAYNSLQLSEKFTDIINTDNEQVFQ